MKCPTSLHSLILSSSTYPPADPIRFVSLSLICAGGPWIIASQFPRTAAPFYTRSMTDSAACSCSWKIFTEGGSLCGCCRLKVTAVYRWDEKANLRQDDICFQLSEALQRKT